MSIKKLQIIDFIRIMIHSFLYGKNPTTRQRKIKDTNPCLTVWQAFQASGRRSNPAATL